MEQQHAVDLCCDFTQPIASVTGGAGTGKTLVLGHVYKEVKSRTNLVGLCAPTGRAAKRIQELTGIPAKTIHRLLEFPLPDEDIGDDQEFGQPRRNRQNPLVHRMVIVDEASMIDPQLYRCLLDALPPNGVIRFFGDNNQLPPVESDGTLPPFFKVLEEFPAITLTYNFRSEDAIVGNAMRILSGRIPIRNPQFEILYSSEPIKLLMEFVNQDFTRDDHQIIVPTRRGRVGTMRINPSLQLRFNPHGDLLLLPRFDGKEADLAVRGDDKFLWIKNDYQLNLFNGEIGRIQWVDPEDGSLGIKADNREIEIPARVRTYSAYLKTMINYDPRKQLELGYAITTHKAQGSEFETIIYCIAKGHFYLLNRRNFYTAVTRAKKNVIIISDRNAMHTSLKSYKMGG
jgi:exodeoxyribonuclease V alpha subunit